MTPVNILDEILDDDGGMCNEQDEHYDAPGEFDYTVPILDNVDADNESERVRELVDAFLTRVGYRGW